MPRSYAKDTFFGTFHFFEDAEGKKQRDALVERFSFLQAFNAGDLNNAEKREAQAWSDDFFKRATTTLTFRDNFGVVVDAVSFTLDREIDSKYDGLRAARETGDCMSSYNADYFKTQALPQK